MGMTSLGIYFKYGLPAQGSDEKAGGASFTKDCELIANLAGNKKPGACELRPKS